MPVSEAGNTSEEADDYHAMRGGVEGTANDLRLKTRQLAGGAAQ